MVVLCIWTAANSAVREWRGSFTNRRTRCILFHFVPNGAGVERGMCSLAGLSATAELGEDVRSDIGVDGGPNAVVGGGGAEAAFVGTELSTMPVCGMWLVYD
jgi:hypothetical protein